MNGYLDVWFLIDELISNCIWILFILFGLNVFVIWFIFFFYWIFDLCWGWFCLIEIDGVEVVFDVFMNVVIGVDLFDFDIDLVLFLNIGVLVLILDVLMFIVGSLIGKV